jgi:hypothetical protein
LNGVVLSGMIGDASEQPVAVWGAVLSGLIDDL